MLQLFRNFFKSKVGIVITLGFLGVIAFAFASMDVANTGMFGGVAGGDRVAIVGERTVSTSDLRQNANNAFQQAREQNPTLSMQGFASQGGFEEVLEQMLSRAAIGEFARRMGLRAGDRLIDSEIMKVPTFQGLDGNFDPEAFRASLRQRSLSESTVRDDLGLSLLARQMVLPIAYQSRMPEKIARGYAELINETRVGSAAAFPASAFAPTAGPTDEQLQTYYNANSSDYIRPERRVIRYAAFDEAAVGELPPVTDAQIAARYQADRVLYAATERRSFTQLVVPTQAAAQAVIDEVQAGTTLEASASAKGLSTTEIAEVERPDFATTASQAVAAAGFAASAGDLAGPVQGSLGWYVLRVDSVSEVAARPLAQVREEIRQTLLAERRREALNELTERLEEEFSRGRTLDQAAGELGLELQSTPPLLANGQVYGQPGQAPQQLARVVDFAFELEESQPQLAEIVAGQAFLIFEVSDITASATAPLAEIRGDVEQLWRRDRGMAAAGQAAERVLNRVEAGATLAAALAEEETRLPAVQSLRLNRRELAQQGGINRATMLFFSMAEGTSKRVAVQQENRWFVVTLDEIETQELAEDDQSVAAAIRQLGSLLGEEYVEQFVTAAEASLEVERNEAGIEAVRAQLTGEGNRGF